MRRMVSMASNAPLVHEPHGHSGRSFIADLNAS